ncbi:MBL fold metallo-hydrolase [Thioclava sp. DLFJ5-1]|uniref:MBL fold metallo-hydrolase n=1 Tax=Thioclava sp. DLFJ5-1 TaxID=1915314 RepID=UPI000996C3A7|nr:MBL fold metallo-hydrolase [Thioclava sp. DLFJ5-1]OOY21596.1 MBL fold metallo-hydrolase [Thioclava sp. DLFJ5-1]
MTRTFMTRRAALKTAAFLPAAPALLTGTGAAAQSSNEAPPAIPRYRRMQMGDLTITTLLAGSRELEDPQTIFGMNASPEDFAAVSEAAYIPADKSLNFFTPTLIETGSEKILFDTGLSPEGITSALAAAGHSPEDITHVVITHMHGDHIGGLMGDGGETFANAAYITGQKEFDHWSNAGNDTFEAKVRPLAEKMSYLKGGDSVVSGISAVEAFGHTPGHMAFMVESGGKGLMLAADTSNHYVWSLQRPDWEVKYDMDKEMAAKTRKELLGRVAADKLAFIGYHMPFPGVGHLEALDTGFHFHPITYQLNV